MILIYPVLVTFKPNIREQSYFPVKHLIFVALQYYFELSQKFIF